MGRVSSAAEEERGRSEGPMIYPHAFMYTELHTPRFGIVSGWEGVNPGIHAQFILHQGITIMRRTEKRASYGSR